MDNDQMRELANQFLTAFRNADQSLLWLVTVEEVEWALPGNSIVSGMAKGRWAVLNRIRQLRHFEAHFELLSLLYGVDGFALSLHGTAKRKDECWDEYLAVVCQVELGKIYWIETMLSNVGSINRYFVTGACD